MQCRSCKYASCLDHNQFFTCKRCSKLQCSMCMDFGTCCRPCFAQEPVSKLRGMNEFAWCLSCQKNIENCKCEKAKSRRNKQNQKARERRKTRAFLLKNQKSEYTKCMNIIGKVEESRIIRLTIH